MYEPRKYRDNIKADNLVNFTAIVAETDLFIRAERDLKNESLQSIKYWRNILEEYIKEHPLFKDAMEPIIPPSNAPEFIKIMCEAGQKAGVGPMAAVAGRIAESVGRDLLKLSDEIIVENGGDIFLKTSQDCIIGIYAGESKLSNKLSIRVSKENMPIGVCTSSGTVGHSYSAGKADAVTILSQDVALADAVATAVGNRVVVPESIPSAIDFGLGIEGILGVLIICGDTFGAAGDIKLVKQE